MEWWTDLWLKEGFANWIMYLATDHLFPDWNIWVQFVVADLGRALSMDSFCPSLPLSSPPCAALAQKSHGNNTQPAQHTSHRGVRGEGRGRGRDL